MQGERIVATKECTLSKNTTCYVHFWISMVKTFLKANIVYIDNQWESSIGRAVIGTINYIIHDHEQLLHHLCVQHAR